jgi:hypothetical protein
MPMLAALGSLLRAGIRRPAVERLSDLLEFVVDLENDDGELTVDPPKDDRDDQTYPAKDECARCFEPTLSDKRASDCCDVAESEERQAQEKDDLDQRTAEKRLEIEEIHTSSLYR